MGRYRSPFKMDYEPQPTIGEQIRDMIEAEDAMEMYKERLKTKWKGETKEEKKDDKKDKKTAWEWYIMLGVLAIPVTVLWNLAVLSGLSLILKLAKTIN